MDRKAKSRRQDTSEWTDRDQKQRLRTRVRQLEKQLKQIRKELEREKNRNSNIEFILDTEQTEQFQNLLNKRQKRQDKRLCPDCNNDLTEFSITHPTNGILVFEKCTMCSYRKKIQKGA